MQIVVASAARSEWIRAPPARCAPSRRAQLPACKRRRADRTRRFPRRRCTCRQACRERAGGSRADRESHKVRRASAAPANTRLPPDSALRRSRRKDSGLRCARSGERSLPCRWSSGKSSRGARACGATSVAFVRLPLCASASLPLLQSIKIGCALSSEVSPAVE